MFASGFERLSRPACLSLLMMALAFGQAPPLHSTTLSADEAATPGTLHDPRAPITVGPQELVGQPGLGEKVASSVLGGLAGSVLGGPSRKSPQPRTHRDPSRKLDWNNFAMEGFDTETATRAMWTDEGLLVSSRIESSPGKGTFQAIFLESCDGRRLYPQRYEIYDLWNESSLSVSWSKTSSSNGQVMSHRSGSWSSAGEDFALPGTEGGESPSMPGAWQQLGFDRAQGGVRQIGVHFSLTPGELASMGEVGLFVHTTRPTQDPVTTAPAHWLVMPQSEDRPGLLAPSPEATSASSWQATSTGCRGEHPAVLVASASQVDPGSEPFEGTPRPPKTSAPAAVAASRGLPLPAGLEVTASGTGRTTGHIADLTVSNAGDAPADLPAQQFFIPGDGKHQAYVGRLPATQVAAGSTVVIPVSGYCAEVRKPPVPEGAAMSSPGNWIVVSVAVGAVEVPPREDAAPAGRASIPGTDQPVPRAVSVTDEPLVAAPLLLAAADAIEQKTRELQASGELQTLFSGNPEREHEAVVQQTLWIYAAELEGVPYTKEEFTERLEHQYEERSGVPIASAPEKDQQRVQQGADDFWDAFELVGAEAKVINVAGQGAQVTGQTGSSEARAALVPGESPATKQVAAGGCEGKKNIHHSDRQVQVQIADSYGDKESREKISAGIEQAVQSQDSAYETTTPPSTAYSLWRDDAIGGISSAYAKSVFLEKNDQEWVWSTDPLKTRARGNGTHTLSFQPGPGCKAYVAGAALMWIKSSSEAFDPLENSIEVFRALDAVKELSVKYATEKLPPGIDEAVEAGVEAITDPASDTWAGASGRATLVVGGRTDSGESANRVVYKRKDKEDKAVIGGGATVKKLFASDARPNSLTSNIDGVVEMEAGATGNGFAKAYLESVYGTLLAGVCECPNSPPRFEVLSDAQMFIRTDAAQGAVAVALRDMQDAVNRISKDIESGSQDTGQDSLRRRVEGELQKWGERQAGERFQPKEGRTAE